MGFGDITLINASIFKSFE